MQATFRAQPFFTKQQWKSCLKSIIRKILKSLISNINFENYCILCMQKLFGQTTKQPLNNFEPQKPWKYKQLWGSNFWFMGENTVQTNIWQNLCCSKEISLQKCTVMQYLTQKWSCMYIWVSTNSFSFQSYLGRPFNGEGVEPFSKKNFVGKKYREIVLRGGTNDQIVLRGKKFHKIYFLVIWTV